MGLRGRRENTHVRLLPIRISGHEQTPYVPWNAASENNARTAGPDRRRWVSKKARRECADCDLHRAMVGDVGIGLLSTNASNLSQKETVVVVVVTRSSIEIFV